MRILPLYIGRTYLKWFLIILIGLLGVVFIFDVIELLRRSSGKIGITYSIILTMAALNLPEIGQKILPFIALFATMMTLWRLTRSQELIVVRASGVSVWQFLMPILGITVLLSGFYLFAVNPLGALMKKSYRDLEDRYIERSAMLDLSSAGLWIRQANESKQFLLHADSVTAPPMKLWNVMALVYDHNEKYLGRIDAETAMLENGKWQLHNAWVNDADKKPEKVAQYDINTALTFEKIQESMSPPNTVSFWELPGFISALEATGFPGRYHRMRFESLLAQPFFLCAMVLLAACFSLGLARSGGAFKAALVGIGIGSFAFGFNDMILTLGINQSLPTLLAAFAVPVIALSAAVTALLHLEDG